MADITRLNGVGDALATKLAKLGIYNILDLIYYFPHSYEDRRQLPKIMSIKAGESVMLTGRVSRIEEMPVRAKKSVIKAVINDETGSITAIWFNQAFMKKQLLQGRQFFLKGRVTMNQFTGEKEIAVSESEPIFSTDDAKEKLGKVLPVYGLTPGVYQGKLRQLVSAAIGQYSHLVREVYSDTFRKSQNLCPLLYAVKTLHFPSTLESYKEARERVVFDELFLYQLSLARKRHDSRAKGAPILNGRGSKSHAYLQKLPYTLTGAQQRVIADIRDDVSSDLAMNRLIQGDVGAGKTDVAVMALLFAIDAGCKGMLMAPTEILAVQHFIKLQSYVSDLGIPVYLLKGKQRAKERRDVMEKIAKDGPCIIVGTHALIEKPVESPNVGLVIIDEQHRFGVLQRKRLQEKGDTPHCLYMTATPIPRTLMLTGFGDLDKSIIDEMPPGRTPPETVFFNPRNLGKTYSFCREQIKKGEQLYIVFPLVEESEKLDLEAAIDNWETLKDGVFKDMCVGLLHGRMSPQEKTDIMRDFKEKKIHVLVATTVIEVGIDVPNATMMIIHHADRFGLSQLHQLRGRVGRGGKKSYCFLIGEAKSDTGKKRIKAMLETGDGFKIAEHDLKIRGPGDMLGTRQAGLPDFNLADLIQDEAILLKAKQVATALLKEDPNLEKPDNHMLKHQLQQTYGIVAGSPLN